MNTIHLNLIYVHKGISNNVENHGLVLSLSMMVPGSSYRCEFKIPPFMFWSDFLSLNSVFDRFPILLDLLSKITIASIYLRERVGISLFKKTRRMNLNPLTWLSFRSCFHSRTQKENNMLGGILKTDGLKLGKQNNCCQMWERNFASINVCLFTVRKGSNKTSLLSMYI